METLSWGTGSYRSAAGDSVEKCLGTGSRKNPGIQALKLECNSISQREE